MMPETSEDARPTMLARCGHEDALGYLAGTVCRPCADRGRAIAAGRIAAPRKGTRRAA